MKECSCGMDPHWIGYQHTPECEMNLRQFAKGQACTAWIPNICNQDKETVVLAHCNLAQMAGTGSKAPDLCGAHVCSSCHDYLDGRTSMKSLDLILVNNMTEGEYRESLWLHAILRTLERVSRDFDEWS